MSEEIECIRKMLEEHGVSHTHQREEILSLFITAPKHYKPDEVFKLLRCKGIGIATVYRTLEMLRECGIIKELNIGKERFYELKRQDEKYIYVHFKCCKCGTFYDYYDLEAVQECIAAVDSMEEKMKVKINDINITVNGLCGNCSG